MRISRLYVEASLQPGNTLSLPPEASHYLANVLRLKPGAIVHLFNGRDGEFVCTLTSVGKKQVELSIDELHIPYAAIALQVQLGVGLSRGERMDYLIQKATELGVSKLVPLYCEYGEVRFKQDKRLDNKLRHWRQVAISASEQSGRLDVPQIGEPVTFQDYLQNAQSGTRAILEPGSDTSLADIPAAGEYSLLSGPEGGFSEQEVAIAQATGFLPVSLGPRILRTETAPVAALAILQAKFGDLG